MHNDTKLKIGNATYLNKSNGLYIPFQIFMENANRTDIEKMLE